MAQTQQYCTFYLDHLFFGVEVEQVQEVIRHQPMTPVPLAAAEISGLINLRGEIVTAIDLRRRLQLSERPSEQQAMNVIMRSQASTLVSFMVDTIDDVVAVEQDAFEQVPATLRGTARELIRGAFKLEQCLLLILDSQKTMDIVSRGDNES